MKKDSEQNTPSSDKSELENKNISDQLARARKRYVGWAIILSVISLLMPFIMTIPSEWSIVDWGTPSSIGDTFGGITAPFISIVAIWVTFQAFWVQYEYNISQRISFNIQRNDILQERFENKFFNFINLMREQEKDIYIPHVGTSKQAFHYMFYEFKALCYQIRIKDIYKGKDNRNFSEREHAFRLFINGVSSSSMSRLLEECPNIPPDKIKTLNDDLLKDQANALISDERPKYLRDYTEKGIKLYDGHRLRLVTFYRSFCMLLQYIFQNIEEKNITEKDLDMYRKLLIAQLSEHQIALLEIMYIYGKKENLGFIFDEYKKQVDDFFTNYLPNFIMSKTMNCKHKEFIDF